MNVFISGSSGFIGSYLTKAYVDMGHDVFGVDNFSKDTKSNLDGYYDKIKFLRHDMKKQLYLTDHFNVVFDLAARIYGITKLYENEADFIRENTQILLSTLESVKNNVDHYFYISSSCIYNYVGCPMPHKEEDAIRVPRTGYDISKRFGEEIVRLYAEQYSFNYTIIRPFNVIGLGEGVESPHVVTDFFSKIQDYIWYTFKCPGLPYKFNMLGSGSQTRSFCYVKDFVDALLFLQAKKAYGIYNVGTGTETSINELVEIMFDVCGLQFNPEILVHLPAIKHDVQKRNPDISKLSALGWKPEYTLKQGLTEMWNIICKKPLYHGEEVNRGLSVK